MKHTRFFKIMAAAVVLALLMLAIPITPAMGAIAFTISASTGPTGTPITVATGTGFAVSETNGRVWFDSNDNEIWDTGEPSLSATTDGSGNLVVAAGTISVPTVPRDTYYVLAEVPYDTTAGADAFDDFTVMPQITASVSTANVGDTVTVDGTGFAASLSSTGVTILFDGVSKGTIATTTSGTFDDFTFTVPACVEGPHTIKAQETSATGNYDTDSINIDPDIAINPTSGAVGATVTVTGDGFDDNSTITIYFDGVSQTTTTSDTNGTLTSKTFTVPEASRGTHTVKAQDVIGNYDTATFTVSASITLNPTSGPSGTTVTVTGTGFAASHSITITYDGVSIATSPATVTTNSSGVFTADFVVPVGEAGTYVVSVSDSTSTITANFVSTTSATIDPETSETEPGNVGMELTIEGIGFAPNEDVEVTFDDVELDITGDDETDADGDFECSFTVPAKEGGETYTITVSAGTISIDFDFYMEDSPPPAPDLIAPAEGEKADKETIFDWETVDDVDPESDPVTYDLQVSTRDSFSSSSLLIDETGLEESTYTVPAADELESTGEDEPYYWRVRAVDAASNASDWSEEGTFTVGSTFEFTGWVVWVTMVVVAIAFFFIGLLVGRRGGGGEYY